MNTLANKLAELVYQENPNLTETQRVKIRYGLEGFFLESTKLLFFFLLFSLLGQLREYLVMLACLALLRPFLGGYHAKTNRGCYLVSFLFFAAVLAGGRFFALSAVSKLIIGCAAFIWSVIFAPVDHPRNPFPSARKKQLYKIITLANILAVGIGGFLLDGRYSTLVFLTLGAIMIMAALGLYVNGKDAKKDSSHF